MKINKRLIIIIMVSGVIAGILSILLYFMLKNEVQPEKQFQIPVLNVALNKDEVILEANIRYLKINEGAISSEVIRDKAALVGKKVVQKIRSGEAIYKSDIAERGEITESLQSLYIIGVDVSNISNFLGTQLLLDGEYYIITDQGNIKVIIAGLVDSTGNAVYGDKQMAIKTVNIGVKTLEEVKVVRQLEIMDGIEIIKYPDKQK